MSVMAGKSPFARHRVSFRPPPRSAPRTSRPLRGNHLRARRTAQPRRQHPAPPTHSGGSNTPTPPGAGDVDLRVDRLPGADRQDPGLRVTRAAVPGLKRPIHDAVSEVTSEPLKRLLRPREAAALYLGDRRTKRRGLSERRQRLDLRLREHRLESKVRPRTLARVGAGVPPRLHLRFDGWHGAHTRTCERSPRRTASPRPSQARNPATCVAAGVLQDSFELLMLLIRCRRRCGWLGRRASCVGLCWRRGGGSTIAVSW